MAYTVTINIAAPKTKYKDGKPSFAGHMWYEVHDRSNNKSNSYGFAPIKHGEVDGPGEPKHDDSSRYQGRYFTKTIEITEDQYKILNDFGRYPEKYGFNMHYNAATNSCVDYTWKALYVAGFKLKKTADYPTTGFEGKLYPHNNIDPLKHLINPKIPNQDPKWQLPWYPDNGYQCLAPWIIPTSRSNKAHGYDPLILNLDGKGIQTLAPSSISARFDHNADGIATATGWAAAGNGILALDLDKNGKIDSGKEIFGNHSVLPNGTAAAHGYAALAELDSNHDNLINQADELFSSLKVWQDINQDGISQANELFTLQALGIQSLNLEHQENSKDLGNGNRLTHIGSYTKTDGTTGEMGDVEFASNSLYSRYTDTVELTPEQLKAPNLQGLGRLRDLREAAALSTGLAEILKQYSAAQTKEEQTALLSELVAKWGATDPFKSKTDAFTLSSDLILTDNEGIGLTPTQIAEWRKGIVLDA